MSNSLKILTVAMILMAGMSTASYAQLYPEHFRYDSTGDNPPDASGSAIPKQYRLGR